jgi:hypothetical protein
MRPAPIRYAAGTDVAIYPIFYQTSTFPQQYVGKTLTLGQLVKIPPIDNYYAYAERTGGRFLVGGNGSLAAAFRQIIDELHNQYVLGIHVDDEADATNHAVSVQVDLPNVKIRTKPTIVPLTGNFKATIEKVVFSEAKKYIVQ